MADIFLLLQRFGDPQPWKEPAGRSRRRSGRCRRILDAEPPSGAELLEPLDLREPEPVASRAEDVPAVWVQSTTRGPSSTART